MKTSKSVTEAEISELSKLPDGWKWVKIGDLCGLINGRAFKPAEWSSHGTPIVRIQNLNSKEAEFNYCDFRVDDKYYLNNGQLLFAWSGTPGTSFGAHIWNRGEAVLNQHIFKVNINESYSDKKFLMYVMNWNVTEYVKKAHGTAGLAHITKNKFETSFIPLPPLPEQRAIVSKIEQLFSELDNGISNLKLAQEQLKVYRQAVLKKAFEGELTKKWREQQTDLPDARNLLDRIRKEREEAAKVSGKKLKKVMFLTENELSNLPNGWSWTRLGNLVEEPKYGTSKKCDYNINGIGVLRIPNISDGLINDSDLKFAQFDSTEIENYQLKAGDILTIRSNGSVDLVGKCALVSTKDEKYLYAGYLIRLRPISPLINSKYLLNCLSSIDLRYQIESKAKSTSGVNNINSGELQSLIIPLCSLPEQQAIVQEIETRLSICEKIEQDIETNLEKAEALRQSILKKAFEGKLLNEKELAEVRGAEDWEPAEVLLEKIKVEKTNKKKEMA